MSDENSFQLIGFGADLLGAYYSARQQTNSLLTLPSVQSNVSLSKTNNALTPWDQDSAVESERAGENLSSNALYKLLTKDYSAIANKDEFINKLTNSVSKSSLDVDSKGLFTLYNALRDLKTIADYAGDARTSESKMAALEEQFKLGLSQVKDFISTEDFNKLTLLFGEKKNGVTAQAGLGKKEYDFVGPIIHEGEIDDPLSKLSGGETFTLTITTKKTVAGVTTDVNQDFNFTIPTVAEDRTLEALTAQINAKIQSIKTTNDDGEEVPLYNTRFFAEEVEKNKFALRIKTEFSEELSFSAPDTEPALYITGNVNRIDLTTKEVNTDVPTTAFVTKLTNLSDAQATQEYQKSIFATDGEALLLPEKSLTTKVDPLDRASETLTTAIATDSSGNYYTIGSTDGRFANHLNTSEDGDAFLNKYDASGKLLWSRLVGSQGQGSSYAITVDANDNVIIAGQADKLEKGKSNDPLALSSNLFSGKDSFVIKYNSVGTQQWMYLNDKYGTDGAAGITTDADGNVYVTGKKNAYELSTTIPVGSDNAYVLKLDAADGEKTDYVEIGSSDSDYGKSIAVAADGNIIVGTEENGHFILQKLDKNDLSTSLWSYDYGDLGVGGQVDKIVVEGSRIYVSGSSSNSLTGGGTEIDAPIGGVDNFVLAIDDAGGSASADWTKFIGSSGTDRNGSLTVSDGKIYIAGTTNGNVDGNGLQGGTDSFATKIDGTSGATDWIKQIGYSTENREATGIAFATQGSSVLSKLGLPMGQFDEDEKRTIETQTTARAGDYFYIKVNGLITKKIEIKQGDTYRTLANRINQASFRYLNASVSFSSGSSTDYGVAEQEEFDAKAVIAEKLKKIQNERNGITEAEEFEVAPLTTYGNSLKIATKSGGRVEIIAGRGEQDALKKLGLEPTLVLSTEELFNLNANGDENDSVKIGGVFAFKLDDRFSVADKREARYVAQQLDYAIGIVKSAYRSLTYDPVAEQLKKDAARNTDGPVPPYLQKQLANYQDGLNRLNTLLPQSGSLIV
ncbi:MAG: hypothetical protein R3D86_13060 [Emcibacteraceae bacterium]